MAEKKETTFKKRVQAYLKELPHTWFVKIQQVSIRGIPDFLCCISGQFIAIELKSDPEHEPNALQQWTLECIAHAGGTGIIVCPEAWDNCKEFLKEMSEQEMEITGSLVHHTN